PLDLRQIAQLPGVDLTGNVLARDWSLRDETSSLQFVERLGRSVVQPDLHFDFTRGLSEQNRFDLTARCLGGPIPNLIDAAIPYWLRLRRWRCDTLSGNKTRHRTGHGGRCECFVG